MSPTLRDFSRSNKHCQSPQSWGSQISYPHCCLTLIWQNKNRELATHGNQAGALKIGYQCSQPLYYLQLLLWRVIILYIPIHKVLEQPWRHFTSLKLCKYSQILQPLPRLTSTSVRWHILKFDTGWGEKPFSSNIKTSGFDLCHLL